MLLQDVRYALRTLASNKGFTAVAVLCLALGIGINATGFSITDGILIRPLPYEDPDSLVALNQSNPRAGVVIGSVPYLDLQDWKEQSSSFTTIAGMQIKAIAVADDDEPERLIAAAVNWEMFPMLGVRPILGRGFSAEDDRAGAEPVILISHGLWQRRYASDPNIVGRVVRVDGRPHTIIGVMPPRFEFPSVHKAWLPLAPIVASTPRSERAVNGIFARLKPGVSIERAREDLTTISRRLEERYFENRGWTPLVRTMREDFISSDLRLVVLTVMGAVTLVLIVACANVANLLLARASTRMREMSVRAALGAGRSQIVRQLLTESVVIGLVSAPVGVLVAYYLTDVLARAIPPDQVPYYIRWAVDWRSLGYTIFVAALTGIVFGLAPALQTVRFNLQDGLKEGGRGAAGSATRNRLRNVLVTVEIGLSLVLLVGALLFIRSFINLQNVSSGFDTRPLMTMRFFMVGERYATEDAMVQRVEDILRRVEALPNVESALASNMMPLLTGGDQGPALIDGQSFADGDEPTIGFVGVTPHFTKTLGLPITKGRNFTETEAMTRSRVALINETMATRFWPKSDPIGGRFRLKRDGVDGDWMTVIGIVPDFRHTPVLGREPLPAAYVSYLYDTSFSTGLVLRVRGEPTRVTADVRREIRGSDPDIAVSQVRTMEELRQLGFWQYRIFGWLFSIFGGVALFLAAIGVYGVLSYSIAQRTQEIGVRVALGATRGDVLRLVIGQGLRLAGGGIILGLIAAFGATQVIRSLLYNVGPADPLSFALIVLFLVAVAVAASYIPARQATAVDPIDALRVG